jgi:hypothetical protein
MATISIQLGAGVAETQMLQQQIAIGVTIHFIHIIYTHAATGFAITGSTDIHLLLTYSFKHLCLSHTFPKWHVKYLYKYLPFGKVWLKHKCLNE